MSNWRTGAGAWLILVAQQQTLACDSRDQGDGAAAVQQLPRTNLGSPTHGRRLASGDINGDGKHDFVIGVPDAGSCDEGQIQVWYDGYIEDMPDGVWNGDGCGDAFGASVMLGDFNADGYDDVAVGVPGDEVSLESSAGSVRILYGAKSGLGDAEIQSFHQETIGIGDSPEANDAYGTALASGDFDCDGYGDLAVGAPGESFGTATNAGIVSILYGGPWGISSIGSEHLYQSMSGAESGAEAGDYFGAFVAAGNIDKDTTTDGNDCDDLIVGIPGESLPDAMAADQPSAGAVSAFYGGSSGLGPRLDQLWARGLADIPGSNEANDQFGHGVYLDDRNADGYLDLVVYTPGEDQFYIILGSYRGLTDTGASSEGPSIAGWGRDACYWACKVAWLVLPPGPDCECGGCEIFFGADDDPCPQCV